MPCRDGNRLTCAGEARDADADADAGAGADADAGAGADEAAPADRLPPRREPRTDKMVPMPLSSMPRADLTGQAFALNPPSASVESWQILRDLSLHTFDTALQRAAEGIGPLSSSQLAVNVGASYGQARGMETVIHMPLGQLVLNVACKSGSDAAHRMRNWIGAPGWLRSSSKPSPSRPIVGGKLVHRFATIAVSFSA